jgi:hypothetical protein
MPFKYRKNTLEDRFVNHPASLSFKRRWIAREPGTEVAKAFITADAGPLD